MNKFNKGDKVYLNKRGTFGTESADYTLGLMNGMYRLNKNMVYTISSVGNHTVRVCSDSSYPYIVNPFSIHEDHFEKYV